MTYKAIVKNMIEIKAGNWVEKLLKENNIEYKWTEEEVTNLENDKESNTILYTCTVTITLEAYNKVVVLVGGTADDMCGICTSVIWDENHDNIIWMSVAETRNELGINEFKLFDDPAQDDNEEFGFTEREKTEKHDFVVVYDNCVTDDYIEETLENMTLEEADAIAQNHSRRPGLSAGNFDMYVIIEGRGQIDVCMYYDENSFIHRDLKINELCDIALRNNTPEGFEKINDLTTEWNRTHERKIDVYPITNDLGIVNGFGIEDDLFYYA